MEYFGKGYNSFRFLVSPTELEHILNGFHFVVFNRRVSEDYVETDPKEYFYKYKAFYEKLISNYKFVWRNDHNITDLIMGFSNDLSKCIYGEKFMDKKDKKYYKINKFMEPVVGSNLFVLHFDKNKKLFSNYSYTQFPEDIFGIEISFIKELYYYEKENNEIIIKKKIKCEEMEGYNSVYKIIEKEIKNISKNFVFTMDGKEYRTSIKISRSIINEIENIYFMKNNNIKIK